MHGNLKPTFAGAPPVADAGVDLAAQYNVLRRRWKVIAASISTAVVGALVLLMMMTPRYSASTQILLDPRKQDVLQSQSPVQGLSLDTGLVESEVTLIQSFKIAHRVVDKLKLDKDPEFVGSRGGLLSTIRSMFSSSSRSGGPTPVESGLAVTPAQLTAISRLRQRVSARRVGVTYVVEVTVTSEDPAKAARLANAIAEAYLMEQLEARYDTAKRASDWLKERLAGIREQLQVGERAVAEYRRRFGIVDTRSGTIDKQQVSEISAQLVLARATVAEKRAKHEQAQRILRAGGNLASIAEVLQSPVIANLRTQEAEVARRDADLSARYGGKHPQVVHVRAELADIRRAIRSEVERIISNIRNQYEVAQKREQSLKESLDRLTGVVTENDTVRIRLRELERESESNRALYQSFLARFKETRERTTLETAESRVITPAMKPSAPSYPRYSVVLGLAIVLGAAAGVVGALLLEYLENGFVTAEQVESILNLPVLAILPGLEQKEFDPDEKGVGIPSFVAARPLARFSEAVRSIRVAVSLSDVDQPPKLLLVTSSVPGEGKSTVASSLAMSAATSGQRVLLIDGDLRHPSTSKQFGLEKARGLVDLLSSSARPEEVLKAFGNGLLAVLPAGAATKNSPDLLGSQRMLQILKSSREAYDLVIIDSPPVTAVVDGLVIASHVDKIVFVVEWENTPREVVQRAMSVLGDSRDSLAGIVLNKADVEQMRYHTTYYGHYNIYNKGYAKYYRE
ncbi:MAG: polysaccharide biosynthesis tyrosine autokinase [Hyphomicrobiaceae bacterium]